MLLKNQIEITFYKSRGPGGRRKNARETAVRIHHLPSGITVIATEYRTQAKNKELALYRLREKLKSLSRKKKPRIPTKVPRRVRERILVDKKKLSEKKQFRTKII